MLTEQLAELAKSRAAGRRVAQLCLGVGYSAVALSDGAGGVCYTFREELGHSCGVLPNAGGLTGMPAEDLIGWANKPGMAERVMGYAAINAVLNQGFSPGPNISGAVDCQPEDVVGMVGFFCPLVGKFRRQAKTLYVFEKRPGPDQLTLPETEMGNLLPSCDMVVLTATSLVNGTAQRILSLCVKAREIILVGATTPMAPEILKPYGVTVLAGTQIMDSGLALRIVAEGGGGMDLGKAGIKLLERIG